MFVFQCLARFPQRSALQVHPCCREGEELLLPLLRGVPACRCPPFIAPPLPVLSLFQKQLYLRVQLEALHVCMTRGSWEAPSALASWAVWLSDSVLETGRVVHWKQMK